MKKSLPVRMCVACRKRATQNSLLRLQSYDSIVIKYRGEGRSFYLCKECIANDKHLVNKVAGRLKVEKESLEELLKEFKSNVSN